MSEKGELPVPEPQETENGEKLSLKERTLDWFDRQTQKRFFHTATNTSIVAIGAGLLTQSVEKGIVGAVAGAGLGLFMDYGEARMRERREERAKRAEKWAQGVLERAERSKLKNPPQK